MKAQRPIIADDDHQVIPFRRRGTPECPTLGTRQRLAAGDLARYKQGGEPDDFRHRMWANLAAFAFTAILTAVGIWLASSIADLRKSQDCLLIGRRDCAHFAMPSN
jgi:hypothetical protein